MQVNNTIETDEGTVTFQGTLDGPELDYVVQTGLNFLMYNGLLPIAKKSASLQPQGKEVQ